MAILQQSHQSIEELQAQLAALQAENAKLKANGQARLTLKVSEKGGVSVYGLGRFPLSLYKSQWEKVLGMADQIREFIKAHEASLAVKD
jgi:hypothetical protein